MNTTGIEVKCCKSSEQFFLNRDFVTETVHFSKQVSDFVDFLKINIFDSFTASGLMSAQISCFVEENKRVGQRNNF